MTTFSLPRLAIGAAEPDAATQPVLWALLEVLRRRHIQVQTFFSQARFIPDSGSAAITGRGPRHLDSWLMPQAVCQEILQHGMFGKDLAIVGGRFDCADEPPHRGGSLDTLCRWLDLPRIGVVNAYKLGACRLPARNMEFDGVLLDRVTSPDEVRHLQSTMEALWGAPLLGFLESSACRTTAGESPWLLTATDSALRRELGDRLEDNLELAKLRSIAETKKRFPDAGPRLFRETPQGRPLKIAVAYDEAFHCYFADDLELLELRGAALADFSPLRDDRLPPDTDVVYIGCGPAERFVNRLSGNACMHHALRRFARLGGKIYAEGSGMAYLCRQVIGPDGTMTPMAGVLPATARYVPQSRQPQPVETPVLRRTWLTGSARCLRGYRNPNWEILAEPPLEICAAESSSGVDMAGLNNVLASRLHLQFAARCELLDGFFQTKVA